MRNQIDKSTVSTLACISAFMSNQSGMIGTGLLLGIIGVAITLIVIATAFPVLWPLVTTAGENITSMSGTDAGTTTVKSFWPIVLLLVGMGIAVGLIVYALKKFGLMGKG